jgi:hypothetical protein
MQSTNLELTERIDTKMNRPRLKMGFSKAMVSGQSVGQQLLRPPGERRQTASRHFDPSAVDWVAVDWVVVCSGGMDQLGAGWAARVRRVADESGEIRTKGQR